MCRKFCQKPNFGGKFDDFVQKKRILQQDIPFYFYFSHLDEISHRKNAAWQG
jgi:hypothetical protein